MPSRRHGIVLALAIAVATGASAQAPAEFQKAVDEAHARYLGLRDGKNADDIPALAAVDAKLFGVALVSVQGKVYARGDVDAPFSIQSISKVFTLARVLQDSGDQAILDKVGVDATGQVFNSIVAIEPNRGEEMNPFVNPGAIATTSLVQGATADEKWARIIGIHSDLAGRPLPVNQEVYRSESENNERNGAIALLLHA